LLKCIKALKVLTVHVGNPRECFEAWIKLLCDVEPQHTIENDCVEEMYMALHNAVAMIKEDHRRVESLYQDYQRLEGQPAEQRPVVEHICRELEIHAKLEEDIFYPAVQTRVSEAGPDLVAEAIKEHKEMKRLISQLQTGGLAGTDYNKTVHQLLRGVQHHVREEEEEMLPRAEQQLSNNLEQLGRQMQQRKQELLAAMSTAAQAGRGTLAQGKTAADKDTAGSSTIEQSIDVHVSVHVAYNQWTQFEEFPSFMEGVEQVTQLDDTHLHWKVNIGGKTKEWRAVITEQVPDQRIAWTNTTGARNAGVVTFHRLGDNHARIMLQIDYEPEGLVENVGDALGVVSTRVRDDLERFKAFIESQGAETGAWRGMIKQART
jgi:uncharacterized membrane protein